MLGLTIENLLAILVVAQVWIIVLLFAFLFWQRIGRDWRERREDARRAELVEAIGLWGDARIGDRDLLEKLRRCRVRVAWEAFESAWGALPEDRQQRLRKLIRRSSWFTRVKSATRSFLWSRRLDGAQALGYLAEHEDAPTVEKLLRDRRSVVQMGAVFAARELVLPELLDPLFELLVQSSPTRRRALSDAILAYGERMLPTLRARLQAARGSGSTDLEALLPLAAELPDRVGVSVLADDVIRLTGHEQMEVRVKAVKALGAYTGPEVESALREALGDPAWQVRAQAAGALGQVGARDSTARLRDALGDASWWVRLRAGLSLRQLGPEGEAVLRQVTAWEDSFAHDMAQYALRLDDRAVTQYVA